ncbi:hypothetical protein BH11ARM1_BH11ARM1_07480 [soil metagenome]
MRGGFFDFFSAGIAYNRFGIRFMNILRSFALFALASVVFAMYGCAGSGSDDPTTSISGQWIGNLTSSGGGNSCELAVQYSVDGSSVGGRAILTRGSGTATRSYLGTVSGTASSGTVEVNLSFSSGPVTALQITENSLGDSIIGSYDTGSETGTLQQSKFGSSTAVTMGNTLAGTFTNAEGASNPLDLTVTGLSGTTVAGSIHVNGIASSFDGVLVADRFVIGTGLDDGTSVTFTGLVGVSTYGGTYVSTKSGSSRFGTFSVAKPLE